MCVHALLGICKLNVECLSRAHVGLASYDHIRSLAPREIRCTRYRSETALQHVVIAASPAGMSQAGRAPFASQSPPLYLPRRQPLKHAPSGSTSIPALFPLVRCSCANVKVIICMVPKNVPRCTKQTGGSGTAFAFSKVPAEHVSIALLASAVTPASLRRAVRDNAYMAASERPARTVHAHSCMVIIISLDSSPTRRQN